MSQPSTITPIGPIPREPLIRARHVAFVIVAALTAFGVLIAATRALREHQTTSLRSLIGKTKAQVLSEMGPPRDASSIPTELGYKPKPPLPARVA